MDLRLCLKNLPKSELYEYLERYASFIQPERSCAAEFHQPISEEKSSQFPFLCLHYWCDVVMSRNHVGERFGMFFKKNLCS